MQFDVLDLKRFYDSPTGTQVLLSLSPLLASLWQGGMACKDLRIGAVGYGLPYLDELWPQADITAFMPARMGVMHWSLDGVSNRACLTCDDTLPLADNSMDRLLVIHALEMAAEPDALLREIWRVLSPGGQVILCAPNRRGVWARLAENPWGSGRPFSVSQLRDLLVETGFQAESWDGALYAPPANKRRAFLQKFNMDKMTETIGHRWLSGFGGVIVVTATKLVRAPIKGQKQRSFELARGAVPAFVPIPR